jgi:hypothetical protein
MGDERTRDPAGNLERRLRSLEAIDAKARENGKGRGILVLFPENMCAPAVDDAADDPVARDES